MVTHVMGHLPPTASAVHSRRDIGRVETHRRRAAGCRRLAERQRAGWLAIIAPQ